MFYQERVRRFDLTHGLCNHFIEVNPLAVHHGFFDQYVVLIIPIRLGILELATQLNRVAG